MKTRSIIAALLVLSTLTGWAQNTKIIAQEKGSITFAVDEKLRKIEKQKSYYVEGDKIASQLIYDWHKPKEKKKIIACSFGDEKLLNLGEDAFYQCIVRAYANPAGRVAAEVLPQRRGCDTQPRSLHQGYAC